MTYEELVQQIDGVSSFKEKLKLLNQHKDLLSKQYETVKGQPNTYVKSAAQDNEVVEPLPNELPKYTFDVSEEQKMKHVHKTNSSKSKLVIVPSLLVNNVKIALNEAKISAKEEKIQKAEKPKRKNLLLAGIQKVSSAKAFLVSIPRNTIGRLINFTLYKYGEWYVNELDKDLEDDRLDRLEDAEKIDHMYQKEQHKQAVADMTAALKENDELIIQAQKEYINELNAFNLEPEPESANLTR
ncbi:MAG: hypothetical protein J1F35_02175 [Erysipelotrichales bacterium]|nr:hypothetical protein [Erysipelotrichales bacterium]